MQNEKSFRRRWDEIYLRDLAVKEKLLVAEYRLDSASFDVVSGMLEMDLQGRLRGQVSKSTESSKVQILVELMPRRMQNSKRKVKILSH